jgi:hypothetical protein
MRRKLALLALASSIVLAACMSPTGLRRDEDPPPPPVDSTKCGVTGGSNTCG